MNIDKAKAIDGWMSENELKFLANQAASAQVIVELGCYKGRSTRALADNTTGRVYAVDPWNGIYISNDGKTHSIKTDVYSDFYTNNKDHILSGRIVPMKCFSTELLVQFPQLMFPGAPLVDFFFIDGDHREEIVTFDMELGFRMLRKGGILAGHDYGHWDWPGVKTAVDKRFPKVNLVDSIWWLHI